MTMRTAGLAGSWYPATAQGCRTAIEQDLPPQSPEPAAAAVVPHAGWTFSGAIAAEAWQAVAAGSPELVVLFATHMAPQQAPRISRADSFETPLGPIQGAPEVAEELAHALNLEPDPADDVAKEVDNTVEVQLPFIKYLLPEARLIVMSPPAREEAMDLGRQTAEIVRRQGRPVGLVGSTDLTHYGPRFGFTPNGTGPEAAEWVKANDERFLHRLLAGDGTGALQEARTNRNACVPGAAIAALAGAQTLGAVEASLLAYGSSNDVQPGSTIVGYGSVIFRHPRTG